MKVIIEEKGNKRYYYLKHSIRSNKKVITKKKYLGNKIPENLIEIKQEFYREINKDLFNKLDKIKENFLYEWNKLPETAKEKELEEIAIAFTYNTNAIEGSTITLRESRIIIQDNFAPEKQIKDIEETKSHARVFLKAISNKKLKLNNELFLKWHYEMFNLSKLDIAGKFRNYLVRVGNYYRPHPEDMKKMLKEFEKFLIKSKLHPVEFSARIHYLFEKIHPFGDGNGRIGRLLMNYILWKNNFPMIIIEYKKRKSYYRALEKSEEDFVNYFIKMYLKTHKKRYLK